MLKSTSAVPQVRGCVSRALKEKKNQKAKNKQTKKPKKKKSPKRNGHVLKKVPETATKN